MIEDVGMSKLKKHVNKVRQDPKLNKALLYNPIYISTALCILLYSGLSTMEVEDVHVGMLKPKKHVNKVGRLT